MKLILFVPEVLRTRFCIISLCLLTGSGIAQNIYDARQSVLLQAVVEEDPPAILLSWVSDTANGGYTVWRKMKDDTMWVDSLAGLLSGSTSWMDTTVAIGIGYEYQVLKSLPAFPYGDGTKNIGAGYIYAAIQLPPAHHRGDCLIVIDSTFKNALAPEISRLMSDIEGDGWRPDIIYVDRNDAVYDVKASIRSWALSNDDIHKTLFLLGRVPVPYSGDIAPDGHHSDHRGAWPCDGYYADLDGDWTDVTVNNTSAASSRNDNAPGDGKFDQNKIPAPVKLQVGRVDFANMSKFPESEEQLLRRYLDKDHAWRTGKMPVVERGLVDNNFQDLEGLGQSGWKNFVPMFGFADVKDLPYRQTLTGQSYLWSYGCGGGGPESASDISSTTNFITDSLQTQFTMLFGSYFGDWDYPNDFLRGAIASRSCLASTWGNRPNWILHHMALGEQIGYAAQLTMNNRGLYTPHFYGGFSHTALMGDPTLRMHIQKPIEDLSASQDGLNILLNWAGPAVSLGYFIYKKNEADSSFLLLSEIPVTATSYIDNCVESGLITYRVRSVELKTSSSGTYYNLSTGISVDIQSNPSPYDVDAEITMADPGQSNGSIVIHPQGGCTPYSYVWDTGQTTSAIQGLHPGMYCLTISDCVGCTQTYCTSIEVNTLTMHLPGLSSAAIYPNPARDQVTLELHFDFTCEIVIDLINTWGKRIGHRQGNDRELLLTWDIGSLPAGLYWFQVRSSNGMMVVPFVRKEL